MAVDLMTPIQAEMHRRRAALVEGAGRLARRTEPQMKARAPWKDRTGNARRGLNSGVEPVSNGVLLYLGHGVTYGVYLEKKFGGRDAIVDPTAERLLPEIGELVRTVYG